MKEIGNIHDPPVVAIQKEIGGEIMVLCSQTTFFFSFGIRKKGLVIYIGISLLQNLQNLGLLIGGNKAKKVLILVCDVIECSLQ